MVAGCVNFAGKGHNFRKNGRQSSRENKATIKTKPPHTTVYRTLRIQDIHATHYSSLSYNKKVKHDESVENKLNIEPQRDILYKAPLVIVIAYKD